MNELQQEKSIHPTIFLGLFLFILPVITNIFHWKLPFESYVKMIGIGCIILGAVLTIMDR